MRKYMFFVLIMILWACGGTKTGEGQEQTTVEAPPTDHHSESIGKVIAAHGGMDTWYAMRQLSFDLHNGEHHMIALRNRKVRIDAEKHTIGFDGRDIWISPAEHEYRGSPRFYHSLYFYFFAMPFVLGDPGVYYEELEAMEILGTSYKGIKIAFGNEVGDSPKDNYKLYYDPETYRMGWLMYTVTYRSQETSDRFNLIKYEDWEENNGLLLPTKLVWYAHEDGVIGDPGRAVSFSNILINDQVPDESVFAMPEDAVTDPVSETGN